MPSQYEVKYTVTKFSDDSIVVTPTNNNVNNNNNNSSSVRRDGTVVAVESKTASSSSSSSNWSSLVPSLSSNTLELSLLVADMQSTVSVILTHPWGPLGGNMHNNVVNAVAVYFQRLGVTTVRFDFVGNQLASTGTAQASQITFVAQQLLQGSFCNNNSSSNSRPCPPQYILLIGYSYGSLLAGSACKDIPQCIGIVYIAPPFGVMNWLYLFHGSYHLKRAAAAATTTTTTTTTTTKTTIQLQSASNHNNNNNNNNNNNTKTTQRDGIPSLFIIGTNDNFTSTERFEATLEQYFHPVSDNNNNNNQNLEDDHHITDGMSSTNRTTAAIIKNADHFFVRRERDVMDVIGEWIRNTAFAQYLHPNNDLRLFRSIDMTLKTTKPLQNEKNKI